MLNTENEITIGKIRIKPTHVAQKCPNCNGYGTVTMAKKLCHSCEGKGYVLIPCEVTHGGYQL